MLRPLRFCSRAGFDYYYGTRLRYAAITINTTIRIVGYSDGIPLRDRWEQFVNDKVGLHWRRDEQKLSQAMTAGFMSIHAEMH